MNAPAPDLSPAPDRRPRWLLPAALVACLVYLAAEIFLVGRPGFPLDDSWIHLQFARNLADGYGLSYNPGHLVTGSTAPLWTALLAPLLLLPGNVVVWTKLLGIAFHLASVAAAWRLGREMDLSRGLSTLASALMLTTPWLVWSALSGMEVPLFVFLSLGGMVLHLRERRNPDRLPLAAPVFAVAALARPEGLLLLVLAFFDRLLVLERDDPDGADIADGPLLWRRPRLKPLVVGALLAALALAGTVFFYRWAGGSFLPTTFGAKGGGLRSLMPSLAYVHTVLGIWFRSQPFLSMLAGAGVVALLARLGTSRDRGLLPALWVIGLPLAYSLMSPSPTKLMGNFGRYYFPLIPVVILLGVLGLEPAAKALGPGRHPGQDGRGLRVPLGALLAGAILATAFWGFAQNAVRYARNVANVEDSDVRVAHWLGERVSPQALLAVNDIGAIKFLLPNPVLDLAGIANPEIRSEVGEIMAASDLTWDDAMVEAIARRQPDYVVVFPKWLKGLDGDPRFLPVHEIKIPDNITMGGDEIVVYATVWTRYPLKAVPE